MEFLEYTDCDVQDPWTTHVNGIHNQDIESVMEFIWNGSQIPHQIHKYVSMKQIHLTWRKTEKLKRFNRIITVKT